MAEIKTKSTQKSVEQFLNDVEDESKRDDSFAILGMMRKAVGTAPKVWGDSIVGFGDLRYKSPATGREVDWFIIGFSPRKTALVLYLGLNVQEYAKWLARLGKHKTGVGCIYIKRLSDVDGDVLAEIIEEAVKKR